MLRWNTFIRLLLLAPMMALLTSCYHIHRKDGPPSFYVDESRIPNAVPKPEPLAKFGNYKSYVVAGKRYYTLRTSRNYDEVGTASWYGTLFHERKTSSGERYDMLGMTAAHKTLPLPTYVEVTNLNNYRKIIVKVNDRGPFKSDRIIDLSYVAAKKLGMLGHGTTRVRVKAIDPYSFGNSGESTFSRFKSLFSFNDGSKNIYLRVGAFHNKYKAMRLQQQLRPLVATPVSVRAPSEFGSMYLVQIGPFNDEATANKTTRRLHNYGIRPSKTYGTG